jgi:hypothetical protein
MGLGRAFGTSGTRPWAGNLMKNTSWDKTVSAGTLEKSDCSERSGLPNQAEMPGPTLPKYNSERPAFPTSRELPHCLILAECPHERHDLGF